MAEPTKKLAVLIDADNTQPSIATALLAEIAKYGVANVKRIYGDWTTDNLKGWKKVLLDLAIRSEEHTSELQSLMRISYAVFCLKKKKKTTKEQHSKL